MHHRISNHTGNTQTFGPFTFPIGDCDTSECYPAGLPEQIIAQIEHTDLMTVEPLDGTPTVQGSNPAPAPTPAPVPSESLTFDQIKDQQWKEAVASVESLEDIELLQALKNMDKRPSVQKAAAERLEALNPTSEGEATPTDSVEDKQGEEQSRCF